MALNLENKRFGKVLAIKPTTNRKWGLIVWECKCDCGNTFTTIASSLKSGGTRSCGCTHKKRGKDSPVFKGYEGLPSKIWSDIKNGAKKRNHEFLIDIKYGWNLFLKQDKKCALSGISIQFGGRNIPTTASLDRIDSSKGYIEGNVQWTSKNINMAKQKLTNLEFINLCKLVMEFNKWI